MGVTKSTAIDIYYKLHGKTIWGILAVAGGLALGTHEKWDKMSEEDMMSFNPVIKYPGALWIWGLYKLCHFEVHDLN